MPSLPKSFLALALVTGALQAVTPEDAAAQLKAKARAAGPRLPGRRPSPAPGSLRT